MSTTQDSTERLQRISPPAITEQGTTDLWLGCLERAQALVMAAKSTRSGRGTTRMETITVSTLRDENDPKLALVISVAKRLFEAKPPVRPRAGS